MDQLVCHKDKRRRKKKSWIYICTDLQCKILQTFYKNIIKNHINTKKFNIQIKRNVSVTITFPNSINRLELFMQSSCMLYDTRTKYWWIIYLFFYLQEEELILISNYKFLLLFLGERDISVSILNTIWIGWQRNLGWILGTNRSVFLF